MKKIFLLSILLSLPVFAVNSRRVIASGSQQIPIAYSEATTQSLILSEGSLTASNKNLSIRATVAGIACAFGQSKNKAPATPAAGNADAEIYVAYSEPSLFLNIGRIRNIYCRSFSGTAISAGELYVHTW